MNYIDPLLAQVKAAAERQERLDKLEVIDGDVLAKTHFDDPKYIWNGILPDSGIAACAASKAAGKTLLLLQLADAITKGRPFMGIETTPSAVLFLELELSKRRTAQRLAKMGITPNKNLKLAWQWQQGEAGIRDLTDYIRAKKIQFVVVDVLQRLWPQGLDFNSYQDSYDVLGPLRQMANELNAMVLLVTHLRKAEATDYMNSIIGSVGITANADVVLSLVRERGKDEAVLYVDGNDIESQKIALRFSLNPLGFVLSDASADEIALTPERREVAETIRALGGTARPGQVAAKLGKDRSNVGHLMQAMGNIGVLEVVGTGTYSLKNTVPIIPTIPTSGVNDADLKQSGNTGNAGNGTFRPSIPIYQLPDFPVMAPMAPKSDDGLSDAEMLDIF